MPLFCGRLLSIYTIYLLISIRTASLALLYGDVIMGAIASQITSLTIVYSTVYSDADQRKHRSSASLAFVWGIHRGPVNSPHKWPVTRKMFPLMTSSWRLLQDPNRIQQKIFDVRLLPTWPFIWFLYHSFPLQIKTIDTCILLFPHVWLELFPHRDTSKVATNLLLKVTTDHSFKHISCWLCIADCTMSRFVIQQQRAVMFQISIWKYTL